MVPIGENIRGTLLGIDIEVEGKIETYKNRKISHALLLKLWYARTL